MGRLSLVRTETRVTPLRPAVAVSSASAISTSPSPAAEEHDSRLRRYRLFVSPVAHVSEGRVGEREHHPAVYYAVAVEHVGADRHRQPSIASARLLDDDPPSGTSPLLAEHVVRYAIGEFVGGHGGACVTPNAPGAIAVNATSKCER